MTLQDWGAIGELVGGFAIIVSLIYVSLQIRQSAAVSRSATTQAFSQQYSLQMQALFDSEFREVFFKGLAGAKNLTESEVVGFYAQLGSISRMWESFYYQKGNGALDEAMFNAWARQLMDLHATKGMKEFWDVRKHQYTPEFVEFIDSSISSSTPKPLYKKADA